ncbi:MAG: glycosyltransferase [Moraxellaceae bacterium]
MKATLVISVYNDVAALTAVLKTVELQSEKAFDIIISQDGDSNCFDVVIQKYKHQLSITHLQQPDTGFLKNKMLNKVIVSAQSDKLIFIDGDCILHPKFIANYITHIQKGLICMGRRIDLDKTTTAQIKFGQMLLPTFWGMLKNKTTRIEESFYLPFLTQKMLKTPKLLGCNMGWHKADLLLLNGFDENYTFPGYGEDTDIEFRAKLAGIQPFSMRFKAIQFHLDHTRPGRENEISRSQQVFENTKKRSDFRCQNGIEKLDK